MNFLAHYVIATRHLRPVEPLPFYVVGNALPDLLSLAAPPGRLRPGLLEAAPITSPHDEALRAGAAAHLATDAAFHKTPAFAEAQAIVSTLLPRVGFADMRIRRFFFAHVLVELALDAALLRAEATLADDFYQSFAVVDPGVVQHWTEATLDAPFPSLPGVLTRFTQFPYLRTYIEDSGVAEGLDRVGAKARQDRFTGDNWPRLVGLVSATVPLVAEMSEALLTQTVEGVGDLTPDPSPPERGASVESDCF